MANGEFAALIRQTAEGVRKALDSAEANHNFWQTRPYTRFRGTDRPFGPRELQLRRDFRLFRAAVNRLRHWGSRSFPGIYFRAGSLPASPANGRLIFNDDPVSSRLRDAWLAHRHGRAEIRSSEEEGAVIEIPIEEAQYVFADGIGTALVLSAVSTTTGLVNFTVNAQNGGYRVHMTEQYWYSPVVFGSKVTTPVDDMVYPANYRFGGDKSGGSIIWDSGIHTASSTHISTTVMSF